MFFRKKDKKPVETFLCGNCHAELPITARVCRECGADEQTGMLNDRAASYSHAFDDEDYEDFVREELGGKPKSRGIHWAMWVMVVLALLGMVLMVAKGWSSAIE